MPNAPFNLADIWRVLGRKLDKPSQVGFQGRGVVFASSTIFSVPIGGPFLFWANGLLRTTATQAGADTITLTIGWTDEGGTARTAQCTCDLTVANSTNSVIAVMDVKGGTIVTWQTTQSGVIGTGRYSVYVTVEKKT